MSPSSRTRHKARPKAPIFLASATALLMLMGLERTASILGQETARRSLAEQLEISLVPSLEQPDGRLKLRLDLHCRDGQPSHSGLTRLGITLGSGLPIGQSVPFFPRTPDGRLPVDPCRFSIPDLADPLSRLSPGVGLYFEENGTPISRVIPVPFLSRAEDVFYPQDNAALHPDALAVARLNPLDADTLTAIATGGGLTWVGRAGTGDLRIVESLMARHGMDLRERPSLATDGERLWLSHGDNVCVIEAPGPGSQTASRIQCTTSEHSTTATQGGEAGQKDAAPADRPQPEPSRRLARVPDTDWIWHINSRGELRSFRFDRKQRAIHQEAATHLAAGDLKPLPPARMFRWFGAEEHSYLLLVDDKQTRLYGRGSNGTLIRVQAGDPTRGAPATLSKLHFESASKGSHASSVASARGVVIVGRRLWTWSGGAVQCFDLKSQRACGLPPALTAAVRGLKEVKAMEVAAGALWIGHKGGLTRIDLQSQSATTPSPGGRRRPSPTAQYRPSAVLFDHRPLLNVEDIAGDMSGIWLVTSETGAFRCNREGTVCAAVPTRSRAFEDRILTAATVDAERAVFVGDSEGFVHKLAGGETLLRYDRQVTSIVVGPQAEAARADAGRRTRGATSGASPAVAGRSPAEQLEESTPPPVAGAQADASNTEITALLATDGPGGNSYLWAGHGDGLFVTSLEDSGTRSVAARFCHEDVCRFGQRRVHGLLGDDTCIWAATSAGLYRYCPDPAGIPAAMAPSANAKPTGPVFLRQSSTGDAVRAIARDEGGRLWAAAAQPDQPLSWYEKKDPAARHTFAPESALIECGKQHDCIRSLYYSTRFHELWVGTYDGHLFQVSELHRERLAPRIESIDFDPTIETVTTPEAGSTASSPTPSGSAASPPPLAIHGPSLDALAEDRNGNLWVLAVKNGEASVHIRTRLGFWPPAISAPHGLPPQGATRHGHFMLREPWHDFMLVDGTLTSFSPESGEDVDHPDAIPRALLFLMWGFGIALFIGGIVLLKEAAPLSALVIGGVVLTTILGFVEALVKPLRLSDGIAAFLIRTPNGLMSISIFLSSLLWVIAIIGQKKSGVSLGVKILTPLLGVPPFAVPTSRPYEPPEPCSSGATRVVQWAQSTTPARAVGEAAVDAAPLPGVPYTLSRPAQAVRSRACTSANPLTTLPDRLARR